MNVRSLSPVHLCGTLYLQISDSSLTLPLFLNANLKVICFVPFLLSNFLRFYCDHCNTLLYFVLYCKLAYTKRLSCNVMHCKAKLKQNRFSNKKKLQTCSGVKLEYDAFISHAQRDKVTEPGRVVGVVK